MVTLNVILPQAKTLLLFNPSQQPGPSQLLTPLLVGMGKESEREKFENFEIMTVN